eukprot:2548711-Prymnesium_polylepis.1
MATLVMAVVTADAFVSRPTVVRAPAPRMSLPDEESAKQAWLAKLDPVSYTHLRAHETLMNL